MPWQILQRLDLRNGKEEKNVFIPLFTLYTPQHDVRLDEDSGLSPPL